MILTLTLNPAIDRNVTADRLVFEDRAYIMSTNESAGGRGINASRVIHSFGGQTLAILASGGKSGKQFEELVRAYGFPVEIAPIRNEIRTNLTITDKQGLGYIMIEWQDYEIDPLFLAILRDEDLVEDYTIYRVEGA